LLLLLFRFVFCMNTPCCHIVATALRHLWQELILLDVALTHSQQTRNK
jgi:hypothetical protein